MAHRKVIVTLSTDNFDFEAEHQMTAGATVHLSGHVSVTTSGLLFEAESADFNGDLRRIVSGGDVHIQLK